MVNIFFGLKSMESGLSNAVSDVSLRFLVNFLGQFFGARRKVPKRLQHMQNTRKNVGKKAKMPKKHIFGQNACYDIFQTIIDIDLIFFGGRNTSHEPILN